MNFVQPKFLHFESNFAEASEGQMNNKPALDQMMACHLFGVKPLSEQMQHS